MPVYQGVPGARWDGAAKGLANAPRPRVIKTHVNFPSNSKIVQSFVTTPWREGDHEYIHEGQVSFVFFFVFFSWDSFRSLLSTSGASAPVALPWRTSKCLMIRRRW